MKHYNKAIHVIIRDIDTCRPTIIYMVLFICDYDLDACSNFFE